MFVLGTGPLNAQAQFGAEVITADEFGLVVIPFTKPFEYLYLPTEAPTVRQVGELYNYRFMINGSYFDGQRTNAIHAGLLNIFGNLHTPLKEDHQLTHVAVLDTTEHTLSCYKYEYYTSGTSDEVIEFQTGPLVIERSRLARKFINASINGESNHTRTLLGYTDDHTFYLIIVTKPVMLEPLGKYLLRMPVFQYKNLTVVNLDGGSSVALYSRDYPDLNFNTDDHLPLLLGIK